MKSMATSPIQMFEMPGNDQLDNKENVVLRSVLGDPNRHTPLVDHRSSSRISSQGNPAASLYTLETRYQPIPAKVLPKKNDPRVFYINSQQTEEPTIRNEGILDRETPIPIQSETQSIVPIAFLEPKIISQPIFYSVIDTKTTPRIDEQPISINKELPSPIVYSITGHPRRPTVDMSASNLEVPTPIINGSPAVYSFVGSPRLENPIQEPTNQYLQPLPNLYSIIGSPARTSRGVQVSTLDTIEPSPILYTIVGDTPIVTERSQETRPFQQPTDFTIYMLDNENNALRPKQEEPILKPSLYALVGKLNSPPHEHRGRKKTPPPTATITNRRMSDGFERKAEVMNEKIISYPMITTKSQSISKEPKNSKSEKIFIPFNEQEQRSRPQPPPIHPEQIQRKPHTITQHQPIQLPDYRSPYANKPYRERKYNNNPIPVASNNGFGRKSRPPLYEPRYRVEKRHPYVSANPTSLERYPVNTKPRSNLWDNGYQSQTDDDEEYEQRMNKKKRNFKTTRPRAPWIPVW